MKLIAIALGGALGALGRYAMATLSARLFAGALAGTLFVNVLGSGAFGYLAGGFLSQREAGSGSPSSVEVFLLVGFLGAFTTFSTFAAQTVTLFEERGFGAACLNVAAHNLLSIAAAWGGWRLAQG